MGEQRFKCRSVLGDNPHFYGRDFVGVKDPTTSLGLDHLVWFEPHFHRLYVYDFHDAFFISSTTCSISPIVVETCSNARDNSWEA